MPKPRIPAPGAPESTEVRRVAEVLAAYSQGWFPMAEPPSKGSSEEPRVEWVQPSQRAIIPLDSRFHIPKSLAQRVRSGRFVITSDKAFEAVIRSCAAASRSSENGPAEGTWLAPSIIETFLLLHKHGHAHSIEAWLPATEAASQREGVGGREDSPRPLSPRHLDTSAHPQVLVGGLYGLALGKVFCGESMFHRADLGGTDASKVCLVHLVAHLRARGFQLLDAQLANHHTAQFGMYEMPREEYLRSLARLSKLRPPWLPFNQELRAALE